MGMSLISCQCCRPRSDFSSGVYCIVWLKPFEMMEGSRSPQRLLFLISEQQQEEDDRYSHMANKTVGERLDFLLPILVNGGILLRRFTVWSVVNCASDLNRGYTVVSVGNQRTYFSVCVSAHTSVCAAYV